jgi:hypothetical protein
LFSEHYNNGYPVFIRFFIRTYLFCIEYKAEVRQTETKQINLSKKSVTICKKGEEKLDLYADFPDFNFGWETGH